MFSRPYVPTEAELAQFQKATQQPVINWLKTKIDQKLIDEALASVKAVVAQQKAALK